MFVIFPLESLLPTVIEYPAAFAILDPVMPSNDPVFVKVPAVDGVPLNLTVSPVDLPWDVSDTFIIPDEAAIVSKGLGFNIVATAFSVYLVLHLIMIVDHHHVVLVEVVDV